MKMPRRNKNASSPRRYRWNGPTEIILPSISGQVEQPVYPADVFEVDLPDDVLFEHPHLEETTDEVVSHAPTTEVAVDEEPEDAADSAADTKEQ